MVGDAAGDTIDEGVDNAVFRLGPELTVRLPRRPEGAALMVHEQRWVASLVAGLPGPDDGGLATSAPVRPSLIAVAERALTELAGPDR